MTVAATQIDALRTIETPEGIELTLAVAGPIPRALAWLVDLLLRAGVMLITGFILSLFGSFGVGLYLILLFAIEWFYPVLFEIYQQGQTPGKKCSASQSSTIMAPLLTGLHP